MELNLGWILLGLPIAFVLGWLASRFDLRQLRLEDRSHPRAYFRGLTYLLNQQQDEAIDAFVEAVQQDPDTTELHFALGDLFRRRGETERAVRVHQHLLARADLGHADRIRAQYALGLDFLKAGLLDHAEEALRALENDPHASDAHLALLTLYERLRDWRQATRVAQTLQQGGQADFSARCMHYLCEQAADALRKGQDTAGARALLEQAITQTPNAARPRIELAQLLRATKLPDQALAQLREVAARCPQDLPLIAGDLVLLAPALGALEAVTALLEQAYAEAPSIDLMDALVAAHTAAGTPAGVARSGYARHMALEASPIAAAHWLTQETWSDPEFGAHLQRSLGRAVEPLARYRCAACGFESQSYFWQCPGCQAWESFPPRRLEEL